MVVLLRPNMKIKYKNENKYHFKSQENKYNCIWNGIAL
jgi:hypothetical protein